MAGTGTSTEDWIASAISMGDIVTPCLVFNFEYVDHILRLFESHLKGVRLFYSLKANDHPEMLRYLNARGVGFDVASANEIQSALQVGTKPENLILSNTIKTAQCIREIFRKRVWATTVDNSQDLKSLATEATFHSFRPAIFARIKLPPLGVHINLNEKFGCSNEEAVELLLQAHNVGLEPAGVHFHVGTQCRDTASYRLGVESAISAISALQSRYGVRARMINIGGGFPDRLVARKCGGLEHFFADVGDIVRGAQDQGFKVIAEPGRVIASGAGIAVSQVIGRNRHEGKEWVYLDDGIYGLYSTAHFEKRKFDFKAIGRDGERRSKFVLAGPTCDSLDVIGKDVLLPTSIQPGDYVLVQDAGAYSISVKSNFNGMGDISTKVSDRALVEFDSATLSTSD